MAYATLVAVKRTITSATMLQYVSMLKANQVSLRTGSLAVVVCLIKSIDARLLVSVFLSDSESASQTLLSLFYVWNAAERLSFSRIHSCTKAAPNWTSTPSWVSPSEHLWSSFVPWCRITLPGFMLVSASQEVKTPATPVVFSNLLPFSAHLRSRSSCTRNSSPIS